MHKRHPIVTSATVILSGLLFLTACKEKPPAAATTQPPAGIAGPTTRQVAATDESPDLSDLMPIPDIGYPVVAKGPDGTEWEKYPSGLMMQDLAPGKGRTPALGQTVQVAYVGTFPGTGQEFDRASKDHPFSFRLGSKNIIPGWSLALSVMKFGSRWKIYLPPDLAYGAKGNLPKIGIQQDLVFDIELLAITGDEVKFPEDKAAKKAPAKAAGPTTSDNPVNHLMDGIIGPATAPSTRPDK